jgi:hypothetical protein
MRPGAARSAPHSACDSQSYDELSSPNADATFTRALLSACRERLRISVRLDHSGARFLETSSQHLMTSFKELLKRLDLGKSVAEFDDDLDRYFVETNTLLL